MIMSMVELFEGHVREALTHPITPKLLGQLGTAIGMIELAKAVQNIDVNVVASGMNSKIVFSGISGLDHATLTGLLKTVEDDLDYFSHCNPHKVEELRCYADKLRVALGKLEFE